MEQVLTELLIQAPIIAALLYGIQFGRKISDGFMMHLDRRDAAFRESLEKMGDDFRESMRAINEEQTRKIIEAVKK